MNNSGLTKTCYWSFHVLIIFVLISCGRSLQDPPTAKFTYTSISSIPLPANVQFINISTESGGPASYAWNFGDGASSTLLSPAHTYAQLGVYMVSLVQTQSNGVKDTFLMTLNLSIYTGPSGSSNRASSANFAVQLPNRIFTTTFINASTGADSYLWEFGDGTTSTTDSATITRIYSAGTFHVNLTATNGGGTDTTGAIISF